MRTCIIPTQFDESLVDTGTLLLVSQFPDNVEQSPEDLHSFHSADERELPPAGYVMFTSLALAFDSVCCAIIHTINIII